MLFSRERVKLLSSIIFVEVISTGNVAIIVVSVIVSVMLIAVAAQHAAKKNKEKSNSSEPEQRLTEIRRNVVKDSPVSKDTSSK